MTGISCHPFWADVLILLLKSLYGTLSFRMCHTLMSILRAMATSTYILFFLSDLRLIVGEMAEERVLGSACTPCALDDDTA